MKPENLQNKDLSDFLKAESIKDTAAAAPDSIVKDLVTSKARLGLVYFAGCIGGYLLSLTICAQCSIGFSPLAWKTADIFMSLPDPWCAWVCGAIFGIVPFLTSLVLLTRFQHRYLLFRMTWIAVVMPIIASTFMTVAGPNHDWSWQQHWILAAIITPYVLEIGAGTILKQVKWKMEVKRGLQHS